MTQQRQPTRPTLPQQRTEDRRSINDYVERVMDTLQAQYQLGR